MKKWIDYLFWKRTWFRMFLIFPLWLLPIGYYMSKNCDMSPDSSGRSLLCLIYIIPVVLALIDNENVDNPPRPKIFR